MWSPKAPSSPLKQGSNLFNKDKEEKRIYKPLQTPFQVPCGTNMRERKERLENPCCHYYYPNTNEIDNWKKKGGSVKVGRSVTEGVVC